MLLTKEVEMRWNARNKSRFEDLGYKYTKMKDSFMVKVEDLSEGSNVTVEVQCDYCKRIYEVQWHSYISLKKKENNSDCCSNPECTGKKAKESLIRIYGVDNARKIDGVNEKIEQTNIEKYGVKNPFASKEIQQKIKETNLEKYGVEVPTQNSEIRAKGTQTCIEKYGVENYGAIYSQEHKGELSPTWKGGVEQHRVERSTYEYRDWRKAVFERDLYTCQCCGDKNGNGHRIELNAHHIKNWKDNEILRYEVDNGVTLCERCHLDFHSKYGKTNNTSEQLIEFLNNNIDKKVC